MTYGVVVTLLVLALIATVIAVTVTSNPQAPAKPDKAPETDGDTLVVAPQRNDPGQVRNQAGPGPFENSQHEEITETDERQIPHVSEDPDSDPGTVRV